MVSLLHAMTAHATTLRPAPPTTPREALATFVGTGRRETLIGELARSWYKLGRAEVEEAVDAAIADATVGMRATREAAIYDYLRTAAQRKLGRRKERAERTSAALPDGMDFDCVVGESLSPEELLLAKEHRAVVLDLVSALDDRALAVMRLKHIEGLERKEVAAALGISEKAVKKAIERGHRVCRESFETAMSGQLCGERTTALAALAGGSPSARERRQAEQHLRHCASCREHQRTVTAAQRAVAALVPAPVLGATAVSRIGALVGRCGDWFTTFVGTSPAAADPAASLGSTASKVAAVVAAVAVAGGGAYQAQQVMTHDDQPHRVHPAAHATPSVDTGATRAGFGPLHLQPAVAPEKPASSASPKRRRRHRVKWSTITHTASPTETAPTNAPAVAPRRAPAAPAQKASDEFPIF